MVAVPPDDGDNLDFESERGDNPYISDRGRRMVKPPPMGSLGHS